MNFGQGFAMGAATAAVGYMGNCWFHEKFLPWVKKVLAGQTIYAGFEGHALIGFGLETYIGSNDDKIIAQLYLKVCLGDAYGGGIGGGIVLNTPKNIKNIFEGPALEEGFGPFEASQSTSSGKIMHSYGYVPYSFGYGKFTPCWYFPLADTVLFKK